MRQAPLELGLAPEERALPDWVGMDAPQPTLEETGGEGTYFYFEFRNEWTFVLEDTILAVTAEPEGRWLSSVEQRARRFSHPSVLVVSLEGADKIERLLRRRGFFTWKSVPNTRNGTLTSSGTDAGVYTVSVRDPDGTHCVIIGGPGFYGLAGYSPKDTANPVKAVDRLIADVRAIADAYGERFDPDDTDGQPRSRGTP